MTKCNFCFDYLEQGKSPACVAACQMRVLEFGDIEELRKKYGKLEKVTPLPEPSLTEPCSTLIPHKDSHLTKTYPASIGNREEI